MSGILKPLITETYDEYQKARYIEFLNELGSNIRFEDDTWVCDKRRRSFAEYPHTVSIYFSAIQVQYRTVVKYFAIIRLLNGIGIRGVKRNVLDLVSFFRFLPEDTLLSEINISTASQYKELLDHTPQAMSTKYAKWSAVSVFLKTMNGWDGEYIKNPFADNPYDSHEKLGYKYIPEDVAKQLDTVFMRDEIDLTIKCIYWILRLIPSRISEVQGMRIDCLKPYNGHFCLFIPTWKQNGGNKEPIQRVIHIEDTGSGGYLIRLIREQQELAKSLQPFMADNKKDALFTYQVKFTLKNGTTTSMSRYHTVQWGYVSYNFKNICAKYNIRDKDGEMYKLTSHQFRHNGITDRLEAGFTLPQIADMTGHHGDAMLFGSYAHLDLKPKTLIQKQKYVLSEQENSENPYVMFGGRILNMEGQLEKRLLKSIRAHRVRGGICGDITGCKSDMWNCLDCKHFIPDREQLPYFREQVLAWQTKAEKFKDYPMIKTNAMRNAELFEKIVKKLMEGDYHA
ncbi:MAG: hypothetical protein HPY66_2081 [Firmicutes bacterium]|nr:hypothetical protein [Bacillota bacterium]